jgi:RES domain-containing protein
VRLVWRLASGRYHPLMGEGARLVGGHWNSPGRPLVYTSDSLALCLAECLVHVPGRLPTDYVAFTISIPEDSIEVVDPTLLRADWQHDVGVTRAIGDEWLSSGRTLALAAPSTVLPHSINLLLNPVHSRSVELQVIAKQAFEFDPRLRPSP